MLKVMDGCIIGHIIGILSVGLEYACNGYSCMKKRLIAFAFEKKLAPFGSDIREKYKNSLLGNTRTPFTFEYKLNGI